MQTTSSGWNSVVNSSYRPLNTGVQISWTKTIASGVNYFTINTSTVGGYDLIGTGQSISLFDKYAYTDYTQYLSNWSVARQMGQFPFGLIMAQADVELDNSSRLFTPNVDNTIGSGILPNRPVRISVGMNQDSFQQFLGFTGQPEISIMERNIKLHAFDVIDYLNNYTFSTASGIGTSISGMLTNKTSSSGIAYYLGRLGFNSNQYMLDASLQDPIPFINVIDRKFGDVIGDLVMAEQGLFFANEQGIPQFWNRQHFTTTSGTGALFSLNYSNTISIDYENTPIINDVTVVARPRAVTTNSLLYTLGSSQQILGGGSFDFFVNFSDTNGALPVTSVTLPVASTVPLSTSYYTANNQSDGSGSVMNSSVSVGSTYLFGTSYRITLSNTSSNPIYITNLVLYGNPASVTNTITQNFVDNTSITLYGRNPANNGDTFEINNDYIQSSSQATSMAYQIVNQFGIPNRRYRVEIFSNPALQIGDYGRLDPDNTGVYKNVWITGKTDKLAPGGALSQELVLDERTILNYFTINQSLIAGTDSIAP